MTWGTTSRFLVGSMTVGTKGNARSVQGRVQQNGATDVRKQYIAQATARDGIGDST